MTSATEGTVCFRISMGVRHQGEDEGQVQFDGWVAGDGQCQNVCRIFLFKEERQERFRDRKAACICEDPQADHLG